MKTQQDVIWVIYRDENPKRDLVRLVQFAKSSLEAFKARTGLAPKLMGVPSSFPKVVEDQMQADGVQVIHNLPSWALEEIWVGAESAKSQSKTGIIP